MNKDKAIALTVFLVTFLVYLFTLCPTIAWQDSATFSTCHHILGVPHSPGFPIYILLGRIFNLIPLNEPAWRSNMMSGFFGSLSLALLYLIIMKIFTHSGTKDDSEEKPLESVGDIGQCRLQIFNPQNLIRFCSFFGVLSLGFASGFWFQTTRAEIYTLNIFFALAVLYLLIDWSDKVKIDRDISFKLLALATFVYGISFTNHSLLMAILFPAFLVFILVVDSKSMLSFKRITPLLLLFLLGISIYLFLLIRSQQEPAINWRRPNNLARLIEVVLRTKTLSHSLKSFSAPYENRFLFCLSFMVHQFSLFFFPLGIIGAVRMLRLNKRIWVLLSLVFGFNLLAAAWATDFSLKNYDIQGYLLVALAVFSIWISFGFYFVIMFLKRIIADKLRLIRTAAIALMLIVVISLPSFQLVRNFKQCDQSNMVWAREFGMDVLREIKDGGLVFPGDDHFLTPLWYLCYCRKLKPNIILLPIISLYQEDQIKFLKRKYPDLLFPPLQGYNLAYQKECSEIAVKFSELNIDKMPIYFQHSRMDTIHLKYLAPRKHIFEFSKDSVLLDDSTVESNWDYFKGLFTEKKIKEFDRITKNYFSKHMFNIGVYYNNRGYVFSAYNYFSLAVEIDPSNTAAYRNLSDSFIRGGEFKGALKFLEVALELDKYNPNIYYDMAYCYFKMKEYEKSKTYLKKGLELNPRSRKLRQALEDLTVSLEKLRQKK